MLVLMKKPENMGGAGSPDARAMACFNRFEAAYLGYAHDKEAYLYRPDGSQSQEDELAFVDGAEDPARIRDMASAWNGYVENAFQTALDALAACAPKGDGGHACWLGAAPNAIYEMKKAAIALDGQAYDFAERMLLVNGHGYPTAVLQKDQLEHILAHPEDYASIEVHPK